jgi:hypothetical protein
LQSISPVWLAGWKVSFEPWLVFILWLIWQWGTCVLYTQSDFCFVWFKLYRLRFNETICDVVNFYISEVTIKMIMTDFSRSLLYTKNWLKALTDNGRHHLYILCSSYFVHLCINIICLEYIFNTKEQIILLYISYEYWSLDWDYWRKLWVYFAGMCLYYIVVI